MAHGDEADHAFAAGGFVPPPLVPIDEPVFPLASAAEQVPQPAPARSPEASRRVDTRYLVRWKVALVVGEGAQRKMFPMRTLDISLGGMAVHGDHGMGLKGAVKVLIALPPLTPKEMETVLEADAKVVYSVLDATKDCFRYGFSFVRFRGSDLEKLRVRLEKHHVPVLG